MRILNSSRAAANLFRRGSALAIGNFDGLHKGHRAILKQLVQKARKLRIPAVVYTFEPHPVRILAPKIAPPLINTLRQKLELLEETGIDMVIVEPFTRTFSHISATDFFSQILQKHLNSRYIIVGYDFTFGKKREGNIETLEILGHQNDIQIKIVKAQMIGDTLPSSSLVRKLLTGGKVSEANRLLQRDYFMDGTIISGKSRGKKMGYPTANLESENELLLKTGVYVTTAQVGKKRYSAVTNIGSNPTFGKSKISIETFILSGKHALYGKKVRLFFHQYLREEKNFSSADKLIQQISKDIVKAKKYHEKNK